MCDTMVHVTSDGVLFAKNSDREANEAQLLEWIPAREFSTASSVKCTYLTINQVQRTHAVVLARPWWMFGAEMGANEHGVVIGNEAVYTTEAEGDAALLGMDLVRLGLERATNAHEAVSVIVALLEQHGQGGACSYERANYSYHNSFLVADAKQAIVLETAGKYWATEEVSHGARSISNGLTIEHFADRYARRVKDRLVSCALRQQRTQISAAHALSALDLMAALREHPLSAQPSWSPLYGSLGAPCAHFGGIVTSSQTTGSLVADLRGPVQLFATATSAPCLSTFKRIAVDEPVDLGPAPTNVFDDRSYWWHHERLHRAAMANTAQARTRIATSRDQFEAELVTSDLSSSEQFSRARALEESWWEMLDVAAQDERPSYVRMRAARLDLDSKLTLN
jgi:dipeptidase